MKLYKFGTIVMLLALAVFAAQPAYLAAQASGAQGQAADTATLRGEFATVLVKGLDSKKAKDGDPVVVQTTTTIRTNGRLIPSGSRLYGHITQAQARSKGDPQSSLGITFDKIEMAKGHEQPMKGTLQAVAPPLPGSGGPDTSSMMGSGQMISGGGSSADTSTMATPGGLSPSGIHSSNSDTGPHPIVNNESQGVLGFKNLEMDKNGVLTSSGKEIRLDSGTQMMIRVAIPMPVQ
jgi:hypothetical protein